MCIAKFPGPGTVWGTLEKLRWKGRRERKLGNKEGEMEYLQMLTH